MSRAFCPPRCTSARRMCRIKRLRNRWPREKRREEKRRSARETLDTSKASGNSSAPGTACTLLCNASILLNIPLSCPSLGTLPLWRRNERPLKHFFATFVRATFALRLSLVLMPMSLWRCWCCRSSLSSFSYPTPVEAVEVPRPGGEFELQSGAKSNRTSHTLALCCLKCCTVFLASVLAIPLPLRYLVAALRSTRSTAIARSFYFPCHLSYPPRAHAPFKPSG